MKSVATVASEVAQGLHFFREALFDRTPVIVDLLRAAIGRHYPEITSEVCRPCSFQLDWQRP
ncbi:MAG: hypothetical protein U1E15_08735 [Hyphomicrobiales bacterium]